jgi:predicted chitinase
LYKKSFFLAQIAKETGNFNRIDENLYYLTESALHTFWSKSNHPLLYSKPTDFYKNPDKLGNYVYRNVAENGDESSGDGYKFRGRGLIQITRKKGYRRFGEYASKDLLTNPDLLLNDLDLMVRSAGWYWRHGVLLNNGSEKDINDVADSDDFTETTRLVHGSKADVKEREKILNKIKTVLKTDECQKDKIDILSDANIEYHIFNEGGKIHYKIQNEERKTAAYYYHDNLGIVHELGKYNLKKIVNSFDARYKDRIGDSNVYLLDIRNLKNYEKGNVKFKLDLNTNRYFMNDVTLASLLGAMLDCSFEDFVFNGFSDEEGQSIGGSESHKNGMNGDLRYLRKDKSGNMLYLNNESETGNPCGWKGLDEIRQNKFNDALYKYGWKSMLSCKYDKKLLNHCTHDADHYNHLHLQSFKPKLKKIK